MRVGNPADSITQAVFSHVRFAAASPLQSFAVRPPVSSTDWSLWRAPAVRPARPIREATAMRSAVR